MKPKKYVMLAQAGVGKSTAIIKILLDYSCRALYFSPRNDLSLELAKKTQNLINKTKNDNRVPRVVKTIQGRTFCKEGGKPLCLKAELVKKVGKRLGNVSEYTCYKTDSLKCEHYLCPYYKQFDKVDRGAIIFMPHNYLVQGISSKISDPKLVIIDEEVILSTLLVCIKPFTVEDFLKDAGAGFKELAQIILNTPSKNIKEKLRNLRPKKVGDIPHEKRWWSAKGLIEAAKKLEEKDKFDINPTTLESEVLKKLESGKRKNVASFVFRRISAEMNLKRKELYSVVKRKASIRHYTKEVFIGTEERDVLQIQYLRKPKLRGKPDILFLDATGHADLFKLVFPEIKVKKYTIKRKATVIQSYGITGSKSWTQKDENIQYLQSAINKITSKIKTGILITNKTLKEKLNVPEGWEKNHFGNIRGIDRYKDKKACIVVGRNQPPVLEVERIARGLFWQEDIELNFLNKETILPTEIRGYSLNCGQELGISTPIHPDKNIQLVLEQIREAETIQTIDRIRLIWADKEKLVFIISEIPLDINVDLLVPWEQMKNGGSKFDKAAREMHGVLPLNPKWLSANFKKHWSSAKSAERSIAREFHPSVYNSSIRKEGENKKIKHLMTTGVLPGYAHTLKVFLYRQSGSKGRPSKALSEFNEEETKKKLEKLIGKLSYFETEDKMELRKLGDIKELS